MRELLTMWRDMRMVMFAAVVAAIYTAALILFEWLPIIPSITFIQPVNVFPLVFSLMFGPAAAWGSAIGILIGDVLGGWLAPVTGFKFVGNFFAGFVGYKLWGNLGPLSGGFEPDFRENAGRQLVEYWAISLVAAALTASIIAWGVDGLHLLPFAILGTTITLNNFITAAILGPILLYLIYPRIKNMGLLYSDVMHRDDISSAPPSRRQLAAYGIAAVAIVWVVVGIFVSAAPGALTNQVLGAIAFVVLLVFSWTGAERLSELV